MTDRSRWVECKNMSRARFRSSGGCFWPLQPNSPGNSLRIPNGTFFNIRLEGPKSRVPVPGCCESGAFVIKQGAASGKYPTASAAVNAARNHVEQSNAYLYIEFQVGSDWRLADELRYDKELSIPVDENEEMVMEVLRRKVREKATKEKKRLSAEEVEAKAEIAFDKNPDLIKKMRES